MPFLRESILDTFFDSPFLYQSFLISIDCILKILIFVHDLSAVFSPFLMLTIEHWVKLVILLAAPFTFSRWQDRQILILYGLVD